MRGRLSSGNSASNVDPMTCVILPAVGMEGSGVSSLLEGGGAAHDLGELGGDLGLAAAVEQAAERLDHVHRIVGGALHGRHAGHLLGHRRVEEGLEDGTA